MVIVISKIGKYKHLQKCAVLSYNLENDLASFLVNHDARYTDYCYRNKTIVMIRTIPLPCDVI